MTRDHDKWLNDEAERAFFRDDEQEPLDDELIALAHGPSPIAALILILLGCFAGFLIHAYWMNATYYFQSSTPMDLGSVIQWRHTGEHFKNGQLVLPTNRYISLRGVTERRAVVGKHGYAKLGAVPVFAELNPRVFEQRGHAARTYGEMLARGGDRYVVNEPGRIVPFSGLSRRYDKILNYLGNAFELQICGAELKPDLAHALAASREQGILALNKTLGHRATHAEQIAHLGPACVEAWLFQEGVAPHDNRAFLIAWLIAWAVLVGCVGFLVLWIRRYRAFHDAAAPKAITTPRA